MLKEYSVSKDAKRTTITESTGARILEISYEESVLMIFKGYVNGRMSTLIQHVSQLNFLLTSVEKELKAAFSGN